MESFWSHEMWISKIFGYVYTPSYAILVNGILMEFFTFSSNGLAQVILVSEIRRVNAPILAESFGNAIMTSMDPKRSYSHQNCSLFF